MKKRRGWAIFRAASQLNAWKRLVIFRITSALSKFLFGFLNGINYLPPNGIRISITKKSIVKILSAFLRASDRAVLGKQDSCCGIPRAGSSCRIPRAGSLVWDSSCGISRARFEEESKSPLNQKPPLPISFLRSSFIDSLRLIQ